MQNYSGRVILETTISSLVLEVKETRREIMDSKNEHLADSLLELRHKINAELIFGIYQREETKFHLEMIHVSS